MDSLENLSNLMGSTKDYKYYRETIQILKKEGKAYIPYLGTYLKVYIIYISIFRKKFPPIFFRFFN